MIMNSKIITGLILLIALSFSVTAGQLQVAISEGWNLVYGFQNPNDILSGDISKGDIKAIFIYLPNSNEYGQMHPNLESDKILNQLTVNDVEQSVYWVYSSKTGSADINVDEPMPFIDRNLAAGWNFFPIYEEMVGKKVSEFSGTCDVEKLYAFEPTRQAWLNLLDEEMQREALGLGIVIKVTSDCNFGIEEEAIKAPPRIPT